MRIERDQPISSATIALLSAHHEEVSRISPPQSTHALDVRSLDSPSLTFWAAWEGEELLGVGALLRLDPTHAEVKSMRTAPTHIRKGVASAILERLIEEGRNRGLARLSLETGAQDYFAPARALYERFSFVPCGPFADYKPDPNSVFMTREL